MGPFHRQKMGGGIPPPKPTEENIGVPSGKIRLPEAYVPYRSIQSITVDWSRCSRAGLSLYK